MSSTGTVRHSGSVAIIDLAGRITLHDGAGAIRDAVNGVLAGTHRNILLNLAGVEYIDSSGLGEMSSAIQHGDYERAVVIGDKMLNRRPPPNEEAKQQIDRMRKAARGLVKMGVAFDVVLTSPYVRTRQTAEIVATAYDERPPIVAIDSLAPGGSVQSVLSDLERQTRRSRIAIVGHEPNIGELAARLAGSRYPIEFKKGAVCRIDVKTFPAGPGRLRWFVTTKILRALRK